MNAQELIDTARTLVAGDKGLLVIKELLEKILPENAQFKNREVAHDFLDIGHKK